MGTCDPLSFKGIPYNWRDVKFRMPSLHVTPENILLLRHCMTASSFIQRDTI